MKALVIEDAATNMAVCCRALENMGIEPMQACEGYDGIARFERDRPDLILLDVVLPGIDGFEVARRIRAMESHGEWTPIIFLTGLTKDEDLRKGIEAGGDDYIFKPVSEVVLAAKVHAMQRIVQMRDALLIMTRKLDAANKELTRLSAVDGLTGIANRRQFDEALMREWRRCLRERESLSVLMCDVDFFKQFNDAYGHQSGDECLRAVAAALQSCLKRPADILARYGGEEFAVVLPNTTSAGALQVAEAMRSSVQGLGYVNDSSMMGVVTVSVGVAAARPLGVDGKHRLIAAADWALYEAKRMGRNRVQLGETVDPGG